MSRHDYLLPWKVARGYYELGPPFRWLSDEECDWWERMREAHRETRPHWTTREPPVVRMRIATFPLPGGGSVQFPHENPSGDPVDVDRFDLVGRPVFRSDMSLRRELGLIEDEPGRKRLDKDEIRGRVDMLDLVSRHGAKMRTFGKRASGRCPFHDDRMASFSVDLERKLWHCFAGCGGGDCFSFVMRVEEVDFREAVQILNREY